MLAGLDVPMTVVVGDQVSHPFTISYARPEVYSVTGCQIVGEQENEISTAPSTALAKATTMCSPLLAGISDRADSLCWSAGASARWRSTGTRRIPTAS